MFMDMYIKPAQEFVLNVFNKILATNNLLGISFINKPVSLLRYNLSELQNYLTVNEVREFLGKDSLAIENNNENKEELK